MPKSLERAGQKLFLRMWLFAVLLMFAFPWIQALPQSVSVEKILAQLNQPDLFVRQQAARALLANRQMAERKDVQAALLQELKQHFEEFRPPENNKDPGDGAATEERHFLDLRDGLASLRYADALPFFIQIKSVEALKEYGDEGLAHILDIIKSPETGYRMRERAAMALADMASLSKRNYQVSDRGRNMLKENLVALTAEKGSMVRFHAILGLGSLGDDDLIPVLTNLIAGESEPEPHLWLERSTIAEVAADGLDQIRVKRSATSAATKAAYEEYLAIKPHEHEKLTDLADKLHGTFIAAYILARVARHNEMMAGVIQESVGNANTSERTNKFLSFALQEAQPEAETLFHKVIHEYPEILWPEILRYSPIARRLIEEYKAKQQGK